MKKPPAQAVLVEDTCVAPMLRSSHISYILRTCASVRLGLLSLKRLVLGALKMPHDLKTLLVIVIFCCSWQTSTFAEKILWPTDSTVFFKGASIDKFIQPTASGKVESGLFGYVRNNGKRFHEGIDIKSLKKDRKGDPKDAVQAVLPGKVVHVNSIAGNSSYGRYVVLEHTSAIPPIYTLYAHLSKINPNIKKGVSVEAGTLLGTMGTTSMSDKIPKSRAHLHFEMGLMLSDNFHGWYGEQDYSTPNMHNRWNGINLIGFDPLDCYQKFRAGKVSTIQNYLQQQPPAFTIRIPSRQVPTFIKRYPSLCKKAYDPKDIVGWEINFTWYGLPYRWTPLTTKDLFTQKSLVITEYDATLIKQHKADRDVLVLAQGKSPRLGKRALQVVELLFY